MSYSQGLGGGGRGNGGRGRGEYYKNRYGSGGRQRQARDEDTAASSSLLQGQRGGGSYEDLRRKILSIDGRQYPCYHDLETPPNGGWVHSTEGSSLPQLHFTLEIGRAQSDPFAPPTRCRVTLPRESSQFPMSLWSNKIRRIAFADYLWRALHRKCKEMRADQSLNNGNGGGWSGPKGGDIQVMEPTQHVLEQTAVSVDSKGNIKSQLTVNLPASGRSILGSANLAYPQQSTASIGSGMLSGFLTQSCRHKSARRFCRRSGLASRSTRGSWVGGICEKRCHSPAQLGH
jgi:Predicted ATPase of the ABC class